MDAIEVEIDLSEWQAAVSGLSGSQVGHYRSCRVAGQSHNMAMIFASGQTPHVSRRDDRIRRQARDGGHAGLRENVWDDRHRSVTSQGDAKRLAAEMGVEVHGRELIEDQLDMARRGLQYDEAGKTFNASKILEEHF